MITLFQFQEEAAAQVADRFIEYLDDPVMRGSRAKMHTVPFYQALSALTGGGKTVILAEAVAQVAATMSVSPVVIWMSRGKVVVRQSFANLSPGGKYHHFIDGFAVAALADYNASDVEAAMSPLLYFATVGTFNRRGGDESGLRIFESDIDNTEQSIWEALKERTDGAGVRRPLIVVYDEAHNLSDQQTELLLDLEPDGFLLASATMRLPSRLAREIEALKDSGWTDDTLVTRVGTKSVVAAGLIKGTVDLAGYNSPMEETVSSLLDEMIATDYEARSLGLSVRPKAIYVCNTNVVADNALQVDDPRLPFGQRQAPPILIWRYLTEQRGVDPSKIAVYANLGVSRTAPLPEEFVLFNGGDKDYEQFTAGDYQHIIFNLTLQEGWDDPEVYFAYVDKSMESRVQITQVIGRVLRQPGASRFPSERLNRANFYVRVDRNEAFNKILEEVRTQLGADAAEIRIVASPPGKPKPIEYPPSRSMSVPRTALDGSPAKTPVESLLRSFSDYRSDATNTVGAGSRRLLRQKIGYAAETGEWESFEQASRVSARWVLHREVQRRFRHALDVVNLAEPKLDAQVGIGSSAFAHVRQLAESIVNAYVDHVRLRQRGPNPYVVGPTLARPDELQTFKHSLHEGYAGLNPLETEFALAIDKAGLPWARNPSRSGYGIALITVGENDYFYPDFQIWTASRVICLDTKGPHLIQQTAGRKLLNIAPKTGAERRIDVQFVSVGKYNANLERTDSVGYTWWGLGSDAKLRARTYEGLDQLVAELVMEDADDD